jgi:anti-sigma factor RsiW
MSMSCRHSRRLVSRQLDDRLSEVERQELEAHLSGCSACRAELASWQVPSRALRAMGAARAELPVGASDRIWRAVLGAMVASRAPTFEERFVWAARRAAAVGALAAALVWGGLLLGEPPAVEAAMTAELGPPDPAEWAVSLLAAEPSGAGTIDGISSGATDQASPEGNANVE